MRSTCLYFGFAMAGSALALSTGACAATPTVSERYATAASYFAGKAGEMVTDLDLRPVFVAGGAQVLYRHGPKMHGTIMLADAATGQSRALIGDDVLSQAVVAATGKAGPFGITPQDYDAATNILSFAAGDTAWRYDLKTAHLDKAPPPPLADEGVTSPDGRYKVLHHGYDLVMVELATGREVPLTADGSYDQRYGMNYPLFADMVTANSETPPMRVAVQWSPDGRWVLTYRMDRNGSYIWHGVQPNPPGSQFPRHFDYVYPTAGAAQVPQVLPVVIDVAAALKGTVAPKVLNVPALPLLWPGDPDLGWNGGKVLYQWQKRGYGELDQYTVDPDSNVATITVHEAIKPLVTVTATAIRPVPELKGSLVISERSGWAQLYFVADGSDPAGGKALTTGNWEVEEIVRTDPGQVLITGVGREANVNPYYRSLYRVGLDAAIKNLTPEPLDHDVTVADDGKTFIDRMSSPTAPTRTLLRNMDDGRIIAELGRGDPSALIASGFVAPEPFETLADDGKTKLYGMIFRPKGFDATRTYPVIEYVYTGPTTHVIDYTYRRTINGPAESMAQIGAIVVEIDGSGTSQRGQAFRSSAYQNLGEVGLDDHIHVLKAMKAKYTYFDLSRVGVFGHSAGGYDTARFVLRRPDVYKVGVASSGNQDLRLDKAWWPEVSMGLADDATWERNSNTSVVKNLKGHLMIMHGDIDDNVPIAATLRLDQALTEANKPHELVILPNRTHDTYTPYFWRKHFDFFTEYLLGQTPPTF